MSRFLHLMFLCAAVFAAGCCHRRIVAAADARDYGDAIRTKYRYRLVCGEKDAWAAKRETLQLYQPDVFHDSGIPVTLAIRDTMSDDVGDWTVMFPILSYGILPFMTTTHLHRRCTLTVAGRRVTSFEVCARKGTAGAIHPLPLLLFSWGDSSCFPSAKLFATHTCDLNMSAPFMDLDEMALAYGIAARLKEAEDSGRIGEKFATVARSVQSLSDAAATQKKIVADEMARHGVSLPVGKTAGGTPPFEIVRCDNEHGKDFAYLFTLRRYGGGAAMLSDYGVMRSAFRSAIRTHYSSLHPDVNPRTLIIDFTEYALKGGVVNGRVAVLSISPESLSYDAARRRGVIRVRIGESQFEDARRWIRRNLATLANGGNMAAAGDAVPRGARFFSEREEMQGGFLEVSFRTE